MCDKWTGAEESNVRGRAWELLYCKRITSAALSCCSQETVWNSSLILYSSMDKYIWALWLLCKHLLTLLIPPFHTLANLIHIYVRSKIFKLFMKLYLLEHWSMHFSNLIIETDCIIYSDVTQWYKIMFLALSCLFNMVCGYGFWASWLLELDFPQRSVIYGRCQGVLQILFFQTKHVWKPLNMVNTTGKVRTYMKCSQALL